MKLTVLGAGCWGLTLTWLLTLEQNSGHAGWLD